MKEKIPAFFYLKLFILGIILLIIGSIVFKVVTEVMSSNFRGNTFSLLMVSKDSKLVTIDTNAKVAHYLTLGDMRQYAKGKNPLGVSIALGIPINAVIVGDRFTQDLSSFLASDNELRLMFEPSLIRKKVNAYDIFKLTNSLRGIPKDNIHQFKIDILNEKQVKEKLSSAFLDSVIVNAPYTVEIENSTSVNGLGSIMALILGREGYNVIAVRTSNESGSSYIAFPDKKNDYIDSIIGITGFEQKKVKKSPTADVTIFLGDDMDAMLSL